MEETIAAISTPIGVGGISIIRISGENSIKIVNSIFKGRDLTTVPSHTIHYGHIFYEGRIIDEVLVSVMRAPKTYTTEDVVEINLHGGLATTNKVLEILLCLGCRQAEPGEFTKRAFLNGRIDLVKAEAVEDVINAESELARNMSINQLTGKLSLLIREMKEELIALEANIEVNIDYPEYEDIEDMTLSKVREALDKISSKLDLLLKESQNGKIIKNGITVALIGKPNVGKSSILNHLLEEDKAIVTDVAGTTRDIVEGKIILQGTTINFIDTAGIRATDDVVEKIGVEKSMTQIEEADLVVLVLSASEVLSTEESELLAKVRDKKHIIFVNKNDLEKELELPGEMDIVYGNTVTLDGLDGLKKRIIELFELEELPKRDFTYLSNARQKATITKVKEAVDSAVISIDESVPVDIVEIDLRNARLHLGELLGEVYDDELIDELFSRFCLGK